MEAANDNEKQVPKKERTWPVIVFIAIACLISSVSVGAGVAYVVDSFGGNYWPTFLLVAIPAFAVSFVGWASFQRMGSSN